MSKLNERETEQQQDGDLARSQLHEETRFFSGGSERALAPCSPSSSADTKTHVLLRYSLVAPHKLVHNPLKTGELFLSLTLPNPNSASVSGGKTQLQFISLFVESTE